MKRKFQRKLIMLILLLLIILGAGSALAAANIVPPTSIGEYFGPAITPNDLKPPECSAIHVDQITAGSGIINGTASNNLILGSAGPDTITASNQGSRWLTNCIVGGAGNDRIYGSKKDEIILGGPGDDYIDGGGGYDICYGGGGNDTFVNCAEIH
jgi:hypothetical protein